MKRSLGTCYYPEHWSQSRWPIDAKKMVETGLTWVRIGEFAWHNLEPREGCFEFDWLDEAIACLGQAGLKVVLGTPTATPPKWVVQKYPDMLAIDAQGQPRRFGSRRHYCFSHLGYRLQCRDIVARLAKRYGNNPVVAAWQTDNEYGCHDTTLSYSKSAEDGFRNWLRAEFSDGSNAGNIGALNAAWGNVFWSMSYADFGEIELPNLTVTEPNPAHSLAFRRYSSEQVVAFNKEQVEIIRQHSSAPISHNFMGRITDFDHFKVGEDLDIATWDSYPLGFLEDRVGASVEEQKAFSRQGHPDFQAFHHDLYRAVGQGRWWVMEQQPGPVNWAPYNPVPLPGMVRFWTWEAFAHGAEVVSFFRWRQVPFAQEQMHAGLLRPDGQAAPALKEAAQVAAELSDAPDVSTASAELAVIFDYDADAAWSVQPHGATLSYFGLVFDLYCALRKLGISVDLISSKERDFSEYKMVCVPGLMHMTSDLKQALASNSGVSLIGPRSAARDAHMTLPQPLPPDIPHLDVTVSAVESLRPDMPIALSGAGAIKGYREVLEGDATPILMTKAGDTVAMGNGNLVYLGAWLDQDGFLEFLEPLCRQAGIETIKMPEGVRRRVMGAEEFWFNHNARAVESIHGQIKPADFLRLSPSE